jgi:hypothetical protein
VTCYTLLFECQLVGGELQPLQGEIEATQFFPESSLPPLIDGVIEQIGIAFAFNKGHQNQTFFDR